MYILTHLKGRTISITGFSANTFPKKKIWCDIHPKVICPLSANLSSDQPTYITVARNVLLPPTTHHPPNPDQPTTVGTWQGTQKSSSTGIFDLHQS